LGHLGVAEVAGQQQRRKAITRVNVQIFRVIG
jgi:hypothetical protein